MNKLLLCLAFVLTGTAASSQKIYFAYFQSESEQPFFVKLDEKVYSSSGTGYLILPRLLDSTYNISLGFPGGKWPEQRFSIVMNKKDHGFIIKNFAEKGWGLFDLQNLSVQMSQTGKSASEIQPVPDNNEVSAFTNILSKAADDPSLKDKAVRPKPEEKKPVVVVKEPEVKEPVAIIPVKTETQPVENTKPADSPQTAIAKQDPPVKPVIKEEAVPEPIVTTPAVNNVSVPVIKEKTKAETIVKVDSEKEKPGTVETYTRSEVVKETGKAVKEGYDLVFIDNQANGLKDTIHLIIPNPKPIVDPVAEKPKEEKKFLEIKNEENTNAEVKKVLVEPVARKKTIACTQAAEESDFLKLRRKMVSADSDDEMISESRKFFKSKCYSVYQIRNLGSLFLSDEGKYKFFDAAYPYASDPHNFISLQLELKEEYYVNRFKAMLK